MCHSFINCKLGLIRWRTNCSLEMDVAVTGCFASRHQMRSSQSFWQNRFIFYFFIPFHSIQSIPFYLEVNSNLLYCNLDLVFLQFTAIISVADIDAFTAVTWHQDTYWHHYHQYQCRKTNKHIVNQTVCKGTKQAFRS